MKFKQLYEENFEKSKFAYFDDTICKVSTIRSEEKIYEFIKKNPHPNLKIIYGVDGEVAYEQYIVASKITDIKDQLSLEEALFIIRQLLLAVEHLHANGFIHRDIKPDNILITDNHHLYLIDYNISREFKVGKNKDTEVFGTVGFVAPEQYGFHQSDFRSDIYSIGKTIEFLFGDIPKLNALVDKCCQFDPQNRFETVKEIQIKIDEEYSLESSIIKLKKVDYEDKEKYLKKIIPIWFVITYILIANTNDYADQEFLLFISFITIFGVILLGKKIMRLNKKMFKSLFICLIIINILLTIMLSN